MSTEPQLLTLVSSLQQSMQKNTLRRGLGVSANVGGVKLSASYGGAGADAIKEVGKAGAAMMLGRSLASYTQQARIAPYVLIEDCLRQQPYITDILQAATNIYAGYYLTAVAMIGDVAGVSVLDKLDRINPNREVDFRKILTTESFAFGLPFENAELPKGKWQFNAESHQFSTEAISEKKPDDGKADKQSPRSEHASMTRDTVVTAKEASNLATGKLLEVKVVINGEAVTVPTTVVLFPNSADTSSFVQILSMYEDTQTVTERWHDWRSGDKTFADFFFMRDLVRKHRSTLMKDRSGYYAAMSAQSRNHKMAAGVSGKASLAEASNILIFSTTCAKQAEYQIGGSLNDYRIRENVFAATGAMLMFVVDRDEEMVKIYHSGLAMANTLKLRELKFANKNSGPDVAEILKAYQLGNAPSF